MKTVYLATSNRNKAASIQRGMARHGIAVKHVHLEMPEPRSYDIREIARSKALYAYGKLGRPCIVMDSGFFVPSLNGFPRTFVNFALQTVGIDGLLRLVKGRKRYCYFRDCLAYYDGRLRGPKLFESEECGSISSNARGSIKLFHWSALFQIFVPEGSTKTLAEMRKADYLAWYGHQNRNRYLKKFAEWYSKR